MADKLYFMVRDLYAIHTNVLRRQLENKKGSISRSSSSSLEKQPSFQNQTIPQPPVNNYEQPPQNNQSQFSFDLLQQQQFQPFQQFQQQPPPQLSYPYQQFQLQHITSTENNSSSINTAMVDWTMSYYNAAMFYEAPNANNNISFNNNNMDVSLANFQIPDTSDQSTIFSPNVNHSS